MFTDSHIIAKFMAPFALDSKTHFIKKNIFHLAFLILQNIFILLLPRISEIIVGIFPTIKAQFFFIYFFVKKFTFKK